MNLDEFRTHQNVDKFRQKFDKFRTTRFTDVPRPPPNIGWESWDRWWLLQRVAYPVAGPQGRKFRRTGSRVQYHTAHSRAPATTLGETGRRVMELVINHLTAARCLRMLPRLPRRAPKGQRPAEHCGEQHLYVFGTCNQPSDGGALLAHASAPSAQSAQGPAEQHLYVFKC